MPRLTLTIVVTAACVVHSVHADAQSRQPPPQTARAVRTMAAAAAGRVSGLVRDADGQPIAGAAVLALGDTPGSTRTNLQGRFVMALPPGPYVLRAAHDGYLSTYREAVRVRPNGRVERTITMVRLDAGAMSAPVKAALGLPTLQPGATSTAAEPLDPHAHSETAWRLRRLTRTILRDTSPESAAEASDGPADERAVRARRGSLSVSDGPFDRALATSARAAVSFLTNTDFSGHLNFVTAKHHREGGGGRPEEWARGIASVALGAAVGRLGNWRVRGALAPGDLSSWGLEGEYVADPSRAHAFRIGVSYGIQGDAVAQAFRRSAIPETRSVGVVDGHDRWRVHPRLTLDYGLRFDRVDYADRRESMSPDLSARWSASPTLTVTAGVASRALAPGADEFLSPATDAPWLPPARTFSSRTPDAPLAVARRQHFDLGVERRVGGSRERHAVFSMRAFRQRTERQNATLFGLDASRDVGHYYIAPLGDVSIHGWTAGVSGSIGHLASASALFTSARAEWTQVATTQVKDLALSLATGEGTDAIGVRATYRLSGGGPPALLPLSSPLVSRFEIEVRQSLPYQPIRGSRLDLLFTLRNLTADSSLTRSAQDELLIVSPPLRIMGGIQVRF